MRTADWKEERRPGKVGYLSCMSLSMYSAAWEPPHASLHVELAPVEPSRKPHALLRAGEDCPTVQDGNNVRARGG